MDLTEMLLDLQLTRDTQVVQDDWPALLLATDAQVEPGSWPGGGVLVEDTATGVKLGAWLQFKAAELARWGLTLEDLEAGQQPIALCEAAMIPLTMLRWPDVFRQRHVVWYVDNTAALASFVKGASANEDLEIIVAIFWMAACHLQCSVWFEWVDSDSNWSDGVSRDFWQR